MLNLVGILIAVKNKYIKLLYTFITLIYYTNFLLFFSHLVLSF